MIVQEKAPTLRRRTIDYRPINNETVKNIWCILHVDEVIKDMYIAMVLKILKRTVRYWRFTIYYDRQPSLDSMMPDAAIQSARSAQGSYNSTANIQDCLKYSIETLENLLLAWLDNVAPYDAAGATLLAKLRMFRDICM